MKLLEAVDLFGRGVNLNVKNKINRKTNFGGVCSFIAVSIILAAFVTNIQRLILHTNPIISQSEVYWDFNALGSVNGAQIGIDLAFIYRDFN